LNWKREILANTELIDENPRKLEKKNTQMLKIVGQLMLKRDYNGPPVKTTKQKNNMNHK
jgi:hypothetical protein